MSMSSLTFESMETGTGSRDSYARFAVDSRPGLCDDGIAHGSVVQKNGCCFGRSPQLARRTTSFAESECNARRHDSPAPGAAEGE